MLWGATFPTVQAALREASPLLLVGVRFIVAGLLLAVPVLGFGRPALGGVWRWGSGLGLLLAVAFAAQTYGLQTVSPSRSAFLTAFYVVLTPFCEWAVIGHAPRPLLWLATLVTFIGGTVMTGAGFGGALTHGDLLTIACAALYALHVVLLTEGLKRNASLPLLLVQIVACGVVSLGASFAFEPQTFSGSRTLWLQILFLAIGATIVALWLQNYGQARTSATRAAVLFTTEPIFAALFGYLAGERLAAREIVGAAIVLGGVLLAEMPQRSSTPR